MGSKMKIDVKKMKEKKNRDGKVESKSVERNKWSKGNLKFT